MKKTILATVVTPVFLAYLGTMSMGCKKEEELAPPPPPAEPAPAPEPIVIAPEVEEEVDAGEDAPEEASVKKATAKAPDVAGLRACCNALQQNAASMPPPNNAWALQAAAICQSMVQQMAAGSKSKGDALAVIGGALKGAALPPACK